MTVCSSDSRQTSDTPEDEMNDHQKSNTTTRENGMSLEAQLELAIYQERLQTFSSLTDQIIRRRQKLEALISDGTLDEEERSLFDEIRAQDDKLMDQMFRECAHIEMRQKVLRSAVTA
jgi:Spy/CpxP family protein refolding chaperone